MHKQMSLQDFQERLLAISAEVISQRNLPADKPVVYRVECDLEPGKRHNSTDDFIIRSRMLDTFKAKLLTAEQVARMLAFPGGPAFPQKFPLWVRVAYLTQTDDTVVLKLTTSLRFRRQSELKNRGTGLHPFENIDDSQ